MTRICRALALPALVALAGLLQLAPTASAALPPIKHVFVIIGENESASTTFGASSPAPYLATTLKSQGLFIPNYYGIGHFSLDNYIAMVSGQAPNPSTSGDCPTYADFLAPGLNSAGQETGAGCVYPSDVPTLMGQMDAKGVTWKGYMDGMGVDPARDHRTTCAHPPVGALDPTEVGESAPPFDEYATRHDPFVYFHSVIDNAPYCDSHVVNLTQLGTDLGSVATTPNYSFITPNLCNDGHDAPCKDGVGPGGLTQFNSFLQTLVPQIVNSAAFKQDGLLIVTFDEAGGGDSTACCGEQPGPAEALPGGTGPGGGVVGAVLLSPFIKAASSTSTAYNHYSMLGSIEDLFGLSRIGYATGAQAFGSDVYTNPPVAPKLSGLRVKPHAFKPGKAAKISYRDSEAGLTTLTIKRVAKHHKLKTLGTLKHHDTAGANTVTFRGKLHGHKLKRGSYEVVASSTLNGLTSRTVTGTFKIT
jgi:hypothetical protein